MQTATASVVNVMEFSILLQTVVSSSEQKIIKKNGMKLLRQTLTADKLQELQLHP